MKKISHSKKILIALWGIVFVFLVYNISKVPSLERDWAKDQKILANIDIKEDSISIENIRDFKYVTVDNYTIGYINEEYDISKLESLYYIIEPFWSFEWPAHTMLSFGFSDGRYLVISAEIRKEVWETFWPIKWLFRNYEMTYVIGTEEDLIKLRANYRKDDVFLYPIKAQKKDIQKLFLSMLERAQHLSQKAEFYNTLSNNCTTAILRHVNEIRNEEIPWSFNALMPANSDSVIYELWLIDTKFPLEEARQYYQINKLSEQFAEDWDYSQKIRKTRK